MKPSAALLAVVTGLILAEGLVFAATHLAPTWPPRRGDFEAYYWAGRRLDSGNLADLYAADSREPGSDRRIKDFKNVPVVGAAFVPLSRLEYGSAWAAWWIVSLLACLAFAAAAALWISRWCSLWPPCAALVVSALVHFFPLRDGFDLGQTTQIVMLVLWLAWLARARGRDVLAGALLAVAALVKLPVFFMAGFLILAAALPPVRRADGLAAPARLAAGFAATVAGLVVLSVLLYGVGVHRAWLADAVGPHAGTALTALNNQGLAAQLVRLWGEETVHSYRPVPVPAVLSIVRWTMAALLAVGWLLARRRAGDDRDDLDFVMAIALMPVLSPIFWIHYFLLSLPALLLLGRRAVRPGAWALRATLVAAYALAALYPPADLAWYGRAPGFWAEAWNGRFLYSSIAMAAACFLVRPWPRPERPR